MRVDILFELVNVWNVVNLKKIKNFDNAVEFLLLKALFKKTENSIELLFASCSPQIMRVT